MLHNTPSRVVQRRRGLRAVLGPPDGASRSQMRDSIATARSRTSALSRNALLLLVGQAIRTALQACYFVLLTRSLGAKDFGALSTAIAAAAILAPFSSWGLGLVLLRDVAAGRRGVAQAWRNCIVG